MTISHSIPSDKRRPGAFHDFDFTSGARGLIPTERAIALVGIQSAAATATADTPYLITTEADADTYFGINSELALMCRAALKVWSALGNAGKLYAAGIAEATTKATETFTITGTATESGDVVVKIAGVTIRAAVSSGDSANTVAAALEAAIDAEAAKGTLPGTAGVVTNVVTFTVAWQGVTGNDIKYKAVSAPAGITNVAAAGVSGAGDATPANALAALLDRRYWAIVIGNHKSGDITALGTHLDSAWSNSQKKYRHAFVGENGSVGTATTLASGGNRKDIVIASMENFPATCGELASALAAMSVTQEKPNYNYDGTLLPMPLPYTSTDIYTDTEVETALAGGCTPITANDSYTKAKVERVVTTKTTESSVAFENLLDMGHSKTVAFTAIQFDARIARMIQGRNIDSEFLEDVKLAALDILYAEEALGYLHKVDDHLDELIIETDEVVPTRVVVQLPESVVPCAHQVVAKHVMYIEGGEL